MLEVTWWLSLLRLFSLSPDKQRSLRAAASHLAARRALLPCRRRQQPGSPQELPQPYRRASICCAQHPALSPPQPCEGERMGAGTWFPHLLNPRHSFTPGRSFVLRFAWQAGKELSGFNGCFTAWTSGTKRGCVSSPPRNHFPSETPLCSCFFFFFLVFFWCEYSSRQGCRRALSRFGCSLK